MKLLWNSSTSTVSIQNIFPPYYQFTACQKFFIMYYPPFLGSTLYTGSNEGYIVFCNWYFVNITILSITSSRYILFGMFGDVMIYNDVSEASAALITLSIVSSIHILISSSSSSWNETKVSKDNYFQISN